MQPLRMTPAQYGDRILGGWLGKNVGSTLGGPFEGRMEPIGVTFYDPVPVQASANDDLDLELLWLHALEEHGIGVTSAQLADEWLAHMRYPWDEYGYATLNMRRGLYPPISGSFNNWFRNSMGATIRAEIWAMVAPGAPDAAAELAYRDAVLDHAEEGVWALLFLAALESAAFFVHDIGRLLDIGLARIPKTSRIAIAIRTARMAHAAGESAMAARSRVLKEVGHTNVTDTAQNLGFIAIGLLYGQGDFGTSICAAVNCGYDTDTTGATVGAILGIVQGAAALPARWLEPIGDNVVVGWGVADLPVPPTVRELTERTAALGMQMIAARCPGVAVTAEDTSSPQAAASNTSSSQAATSITSSPQDVGGEPEAPEPGPAPPPAASITSSAPAASITSSPQAAGGEPETPAPEPGPAPPPAVADTSSPQAVGGEPEAPAPEPRALWLDASASAPLLSASSTASVRRIGDLEVSVDYGSLGPVVAPGAATNVVVELRNLAETTFEGRVEVSVGSGWRVVVPGAQGPTVRMEPGKRARLGYVLKCPPEGLPSAEHTVETVVTDAAGRAQTLGIRLLAASCWWLVGPLPNNYETGYDHTFPVEIKPGLTETYLGRGGGLVAWHKATFGQTVMDLEPVFNGIPGIAYARTTLHVPEPLDARLIVHTNDGARAWLNGRVVYQVHAHEPFRPSLCSGPGADVRLVAGDNQLLVKMARCGEPYALALSWVDRDGNPIRDLGNTRW